MDPHDFQTYVRGGILAGMFHYLVEHVNDSLLNDAILSTTSVNLCFSAITFNKSLNSRILQLKKGCTKTNVKEDFELPCLLVIVILRIICYLFSKNYHGD